MGVLKVGVEVGGGGGEEVWRQEISERSVCINVNINKLMLCDTN